MVILIFFIFKHSDAFFSLYTNSSKTVSIWIKISSQNISLKLNSTKMYCYSFSWKFLYNTYTLIVLMLGDRQTLSNLSPLSTVQTRWRSIYIYNFYGLFYIKEKLHYILPLSTIYCVPSSKVCKATYLTHLAVWLECAYISYNNRRSHPYLV